MLKEREGRRGIREEKKGMKDVKGYGREATGRKE